MYLCICLCVCVYKSENNLPELVLSSYHVGLEDQTQVIRFGGKHLYLMNDHAAPNQFLIHNKI